MTKSIAEYWDQAMSYDEYLSQMTQRREQYDANFASTEPTDFNLQGFANRELRFLIITEDWCGDSSQIVPPIARLADENHDIAIRFLLRPDVLELADRYRDASGRQPIPVIIVLDEKGDECGVLLERPAVVTEMMAAETRRFARENSHLEGVRRAYQNMPEDTKAAVSANIENWRATHQHEIASLVFEELQSIVRSYVRA